ncbi:MAG TPA: chorismate synthase [Candidatus Poseidoniales archaeon]|nr:MAG TPA: chorismate synthase [Candidatus Poseidoniales archaeon]|tara:strand:- start:3581 stop:4654 length:1074 start_codon:yes stop_codon:yes gene_type:complete
MKMRLGETLSVTLFGESHGHLVGALLEGVPAGLPIDEERIAQRMSTRRPGGHFASKRKEVDAVELLAGIHNGFSTGQPILIQIRNKDARESDYSFIPNHPRPGHQDLMMHLRTGGFADLRGGGSSSARLTAGLVAAAAIVEPLLGDIHIDAHVAAIGSIESARIDDCPEEWENELCEQLRCRDPNVVEAMKTEIERIRKERNSIGSRVDVLVSNLPLGLGEPWFDGLEPALGRAYLSIPAARGVAFGRGFGAVRMTGLEHNNPWGGTTDNPLQEGEQPDGSIAGLTSGSDVFAQIAFKPPSSIAHEQTTLELSYGEKKPLVVKGRHDPVLGPRAVSVAKAMTTLVLCDLLMRKRDAL